MSGPYKIELCSDGSNWHLADSCESVEAALSLFEQWPEDGNAVRLVERRGRGTTVLGVRTVEELPHIVEVALQPAPQRPLAMGGRQACLAGTLNGDRVASMRSLRAKIRDAQNEFDMHPSDIAALTLAALHAAMSDLMMKLGDTTG